MDHICMAVSVMAFLFVFIARVLGSNFSFPPCTEGRDTQRPPTFPLGAVVHLRLLTVLQVRMRQDVVCRGRAQQLLGTAAVQAVLTAVGGCDSFRRAPQTSALPAEWTPSGAGSLTDSTAWDHREVLTETERELRSDLQLMLLHKTASPDSVRFNWLVLLFFSFSFMST